MRKERRSTGEERWDQPGAKLGGRSEYLEPVGSVEPVELAENLNMTRSITTISSVNSRLRGNNSLLSLSLGRAEIPVKVSRKILHCVSAGPRWKMFPTTQTIMSVALLRRRSRLNLLVKSRFFVFHCKDDLVFVIESPVSTKEAFEDSVRNESGNTSQDQSKICGDRLVSLTLSPLQRTWKSFYSRLGSSRLKKLWRDWLVRILLLWLSVCVYLNTNFKQIIIF